MAKNKLIDLLTTLSAAEWGSLRKTIKRKTSTSSEMFLLFDYMQKNLTKPTSSWVSTETHAKLFPNIQYKTFLNMMSKLDVWVQEWIIERHHQDNPLQNQIILLKSYLSRGLYKRASQVLAQVETQLQQLPKESLDTIALSEDLYHTMYYSDHPIKYDKEAMIMAKLADTFGHRHHVLQHLYTAENINNNRLLKGSASREPDHFDYSLVSKLVRHNDVEAFHSLVSAVFDDTWAKGDQLYHIIMMYCVVWSGKLWQLGRLTDREICKTVYLRAIKDGLLIDAPKIPVARYYNIISTLYDYKNGTWIRKFAESHHQKVALEHPEDHYHLGLATINFYEGNYDGVIESLRTTKFKSPTRNIRMYGLLCIAWYEKRSDAVDIYKDILQKFKAYLRKYKPSVSAYLHDSHLHLVQMLENLDQPERNKNIDLNKYTPLIYRTYFSQYVSHKKSPPI